MNADFIVGCRREWKRLGVPLHVAEEMAAELTADLEEAQADGVSATELVGDDPRAFAASWAAARGVGRERRRLRPALIVLATAGAAALAITGTVLLATRTTSQPTQVALPLMAQQTAVRVIVGAGVIRSASNGRGVAFVSPRAVSYSSPAATRSGSRTLDLTLLSTGLAFLILLSLAAPRLGRPPARPAGP